MRRCDWATNDLAIRYHDEEWGVPVHDDRRWFEFLILEGAQAGLSWDTILRKREAYRHAFAGFHPETVAGFDEARIETLLADPGIVRNRLKVTSAVKNARAFLRVQDEFDGFDPYIWRFVEGRPVRNVWHDLGFQIVIFLAGLSAIPDVYYEATRLDGAGRWHLFRHITLPLLNPTIVFLAVTSAISSLQVFAQVQNMSAQGTGGPLNSTLSLVLYVYQKAFGGAYQMGYASAMTVVLFVLILLVTLIQLRVLSRRYDY